MASHELVLKDMASHPMPGKTNENHRNVSDRIASIQAEFSNQRLHEYEANVLITQSPCSVKLCYSSHANTTLCNITIQPLIGNGPIFASSHAAFHETVIQYIMCTFNIRVIQPKFFRIRINKTGKVYSFEYTKVPKVFFMPHTAKHY
jgi:hypothetical protein